MANISQILEGRGKTHGDFVENANVSQSLKTALKQGSNYNTLDNVLKEALDALCGKLSRIVCGDCYELDHWRDIIGYTTLAEHFIEIEFEKDTEHKEHDTIVLPKIGSPISPYAKEGV
jgi:hypothetical protein